MTSLKPTLTLLLIATAIQASYAYGDSAGCCTLEDPIICSYTTSNWLSTRNGRYPDLSTYPGFSWGSNYLWIQNEADLIDFSQQYTVDMDTVFDYDYYYNPITAGSGNYLHFFFVPDAIPQKKVLLHSATIPADGWRHANMSCNNPTNYCCGTINNFPCTGTIEIIGSYSSSAPTGLYAIDDIGTCGTLPPSTSTAKTTTQPTTPTTTQPTTTKTTPPTTLTTTQSTTLPTTQSTTQTTTQATTTQTTTSPTTTTTPSTTATTSLTTATTQITTSATTMITTPPQPTYMCCNFEINTCNWGGTTDWHWTKSSQPSPPPPSHAGNYMWTQTNAANLISGKQSNISESTVFSLAYFVTGFSGSDALMIAFVETGSSAQNIQASLTNTGNNWLLASVDCSPKPAFSSPGCCSKYPCEGNVNIVASFIDAGTLFAIDDTANNGGCGNSLPCCYFDDDIVCGFSNEPASDANGWFWSGNDTPDIDYPGFNPTNGYVWYQTSEPLDDSQTFQSPLITIVPSTVVTITFYAYIDTQINGTQLTFYVNNPDTGVSSTIFVQDRSVSQWLNFQAFDLYDLFCTEDPCMGYIFVEAEVSAESEGRVFFAIDAISTADLPYCTMPGKSSNGDVRYLDF